MTQELFTSLMEKSVSIAVLVFFAIYFMKQIEKKDNLHNETTKEFINLAKESNQVHIETKNAMIANTTKLESLHSDMNNGRFCKVKS